MKKQREYIVPMKFSGRGCVYVTASSPGEAAAKVDAGDFRDDEITETTDWERCGEPEVNA